MQKKMFRQKKIMAGIMAGILACSSLTVCANDEGFLSENETVKSEMEDEKISVGDDGTVRKDLTAIEVSKLMGNGINLGNTMEAYGHMELGTDADICDYETYWGQPVTTQEMLNGMKECGFDSIRIPTAWTNAMDFESGDYTIGEAYLKRIDEIITYARNASMYVIINDHWDGSWWGMFGSSNEQDRKQAMEMYTSMWTQIAERYKEYSDYLIFESGNEELGDRLNDIDICKDSGSLSEDECYETANEINQTFVNVVRSTGGNNLNRFLLIAGYNTDIEHTCDERYVMPTDSAQNKLLVSVHYYTPWNYCGTESVENWGTVDDLKEQNMLLEKMSKFTEQGYGVVIGEYAVIPTEQGIKENTDDYVKNFLNNCDLYGYCPMLWDCSDFYIRKELRFADDELKEIYALRNVQAQESLTDEQIRENAKKEIENALDNAPEEFEMNVEIDKLNGSIAWIMFSSNDWAYTYSAGDTYEPDSIAAGMAATDAKITGEGTYTVALDFTGTTNGYANGIGFSAIGISNGELLYPGYTVEIKEILVNGEDYELLADPYTTSDDKKCTRVNLYNSWVSEIDPATARTTDGDRSDISAVLMDNADLPEIKTLEITFDYIAP